MNGKPSECQGGRVHLIGAGWIHKRVSIQYDAMMTTKEVGIRIRVEKELRKAFQSACLAENRHASDVLREFMRLYALRQQEGLQANLFARIDKTTREEHHSNE
jgi:hypothetical protein